MQDTGASAQGPERVQKDRSNPAVRPQIGLPLQKCYVGQHEMVSYERYLQRNRCLKRRLKPARSQASRLLQFYRTQACRRKFDRTAQGHVVDCDNKGFLVARTRPKYLATKQRDARQRTDHLVRLTLLIKSYFCIIEAMLAHK